jgi:ParB family chromosome partitioning protein
MARKTGLGRGLEALIPTGGEERPLSGGVTLAAVSDISPNPRQPRAHIEGEELAELAESIREHGVIQPLIVTQSELAEGPGGYVLVAGERRLLAARMAGLESVPVIVREASDQQRLELALVENVQRADLGPLEAAQAYRQLAEDFDLSHEEIAARVGKKRATVTNTLRLLKLPSGVQQALADGRISEGHARALLMLATPQAQTAAMQTILAQDLNVRQAEALVRRLSGERPAPKAKAPHSPEVAALEERLQVSLGTRVNLNRRRNGGTLTIHFYSDEELDALVDRILGHEQGD